MWWQPVRVHDAQNARIDCHKSKYQWAALHVTCPICSASSPLSQAVSEIPRHATGHSIFTETGDAVTDFKISIPFQFNRQILGIRNDAIPDEIVARKFIIFGNRQRSRNSGDSPELRRLNRISGLRQCNLTLLFPHYSIKFREHFSQPLPGFFAQIIKRENSRLNICDCASRYR